MLEHVLEYERQFKVIYDPSRNLLLAPRNECGRLKFICTTIRPTKLPYTELYEWDKCAKFIADFLEYEELTAPNKLPDTVPSPANVLQWQAGDSFDFAITLCSLLIGCGYDAYCVYGTAPREITTKDEALMDCPFPIDMPDNDDQDDPEVDKDEEHMITKKESEVKPIEDFRVTKKYPHHSEFDDAMKDAKDTEEGEAARKAVTIDDDIPDFEREDEYGQSRLHCWVLLQKGNREIQETFFIEPTTGRKYAIEDAPYYSVEAIFNNKNFWINLDPARGLDEINFDFQDDNTGEWEYVMLQTQEKKKSGDNDGDDDGHPIDEDETDENEGGAAAKKEEDVLDMPPPWSPKLFINKDKFIDLCPNGEKTVFYKKCKVDFYAECTQVDGIVRRITIYEDYKRLITKEIRCYYKNRKDNLILRRRFPYQFKLVEHYESSASSHYWKKIIQIDGRIRKIYFYHHRNKDGLIYREEQIGRKTFERYKGREDRLVYRSVTFNPNWATREEKSLTLTDNHHIDNIHKGESIIIKMTQKFAMDAAVQADLQIRKTEFNLEKDKVYIYKHYNSGRITTGSDEYNRGELLGSDNKVGGGAGDGGDRDNDSENQKAQTNKRILDMERVCHDQIKEQEKCALQETNWKADFEKNIQVLRQNANIETLFSKVLEKTIYDKARDKMKQGKKSDEEEKQNDKEKDYLAPILKKLGFSGKDLNEEAALMVKNEALRNLKERLLTRAEIIQRRLEEEQKLLESAYVSCFTSVIVCLLVG